MKSNHTIKESLETIGYRLSDCGNCWRSNAVYRSGDNPTALMIYKDTGVWYDFVENIGPFPLEKLIRLTIGDDNIDKLGTFLDSIKINGNSQPKTEYIEMDKIYPHSSLESLFPNYTFYNKRNISDDTLKLYKSGLSGDGKMYRRYTFPIYNDYGQIIGFSGRKIDEDSQAPKWKHVGRKTKWVYPLYTNKEFLEACYSSDDIYIVESIGDSLALTENGIKNHLVSFGLKLSSSVVSTLLALNPKRIFISFNNDLDSDVNRGLESSIKNFLDLLSYFDKKKLYIKPPSLNDFGDMQLSNLSFQNWVNDDNIYHINYKSDFSSMKLSKSQLKNLSNVKK